MYQEHKIRYFMIWQQLTNDHSTAITAIRNDGKTFGRDYKNPTRATLNRLDRLARDYHLTTIIKPDRLAIFIDNRKV